MSIPAYSVPGRTPAAPLTATKEVVLAGARGPERRSVTFVWLRELRAWVSLDRGAARRSASGKWYARRLFVRGKDLAGAPVELQTDVMGTLTKIERWLDSCAPASRAEIDIDGPSEPSAWGLRGRFYALHKHRVGAGPDVNGGRLVSWSSRHDLSMRERVLLSRLPADQGSRTHADLWHRAIAAGLATNEEMEIAREISAVDDPLAWNYAGD